MGTEKRSSRVPANVWLSFNVRLNDGTLERLSSRRSRHREVPDDVNGDDRTFVEISRHANR